MVHTLWSIRTAKKTQKVVDKNGRQDASSREKKKIRVELMMNPDTEAVDRLSDLPDDLILEIFSSLTTESTIATSVLSKRWKGLWREMTNLKFDNKLHQHNFSDHVISTLLSYQKPAIQSLTIRVTEKCDPINLAIWVAIAFAKRTSKLVLRLEDLAENITIPDGTFARNNNLQVLKLIGPMYFYLPLPNVGLHFLKELHLYYVKFENGNTVLHLLKGCSVLEVLVLLIRVTSGITNIRINSPSLLKLTLGVDDCGEQNFAIQTPQLQYLEIQKLQCIGYIMMDKAPKLSVAKINRGDGDMLDNILDTIPCVEQLALSAPLTIPARNIYYSLRILEVDTNECEWCNQLIKMLICSPNLETLKINGGLHPFWGARWTFPQYVPQCLTSHLHTLIWKSYICDESDDRDVAMFILENSPHLSKATFTVPKPDNIVHLKRRNEMLNMLFNAVRASPSCHIVFEDYHNRQSNNNTKEDPDF